MLQRLIFSCCETLPLSRPALSPTGLLPLVFLIFSLSRPALRKRTRVHVTVLLTGARVADGGADVVACCSFTHIPSTRAVVPVWSLWPLPPPPSLGLGSTLTGVCVCMLLGSARGCFEEEVTVTESYLPLLFPWLPHPPVPPPPHLHTALFSYTQFRQGSGLS